MANQRDNTSGDNASVGEVIEFVKTYAQQETVGPLKGAGRWIAWGAMGSLTLALGLFLLLLGLLRMMQTEWGPGRAWSWVPYVVVAAACAGVIVVALRRINKTYLNKES